MKKLFIILSVATIGFSSCEKEQGETVTPCVTRKAMLISIQVKDNEFVPATVNVIPGDTIKWVWVQGFHTTTSTSTPAGSTTWDAQIDNISSANNTFQYVIPVAGTYNYKCSYHGPGMVGTIIATPPC